MNKIGLIIGFGSIGKQQFKAMKESKIFKKIYILSKHETLKKNNLLKLNEILNIDPDIIIICSETTEHFSQLKFIEKNLKNKIILVEKPIFSKSIKLNIKNNKVFVGYNLRYDPMLQYLKKNIQRKKIFVSNIICNSYLPNWRRRHYSKIYSSQKNKGGGVHLDLSHEIDYTNWIFKDLRTKNIFLNKISNLKINSIDYFNFIGESKFSKIININLSYFSFFEQRKIEIFSDKDYMQIDLLNRSIQTSKLKKIKFKKFKKLSSIERMKMQIKDINKSKPVYACTYKQAAEVLKIIGV